MNLNTDLSVKQLNYIANNISGETKDLYTARGSCVGCGECCSRILPITIVEKIVLKELASHIEPRPAEGDIDLTCPFLSEENTCRIYDKRPYICRTFRCDKKVDEFGSEDIQKHMMYLHDANLEDLRKLWE